jgi:hypothetical protein
MNDIWWLVFVFSLLPSGCTLTEDLAAWLHSNWRRNPERYDRYQELDIRADRVHGPSAAAWQVASRPVLLEVYVGRECPPLHSSHFYPYVLFAQNARSEDSHGGDYEEWRLLGFVRTNVSEELSASIIGSQSLVTLIMETRSSAETSVLTRATRLTSQKTPFFIVTAVKTSNRTLQTWVYKNVYSNLEYMFPLCPCNHLRTASYNSLNNPQRNIAGIYSCVTACLSTNARFSCYDMQFWSPVHGSNRPRPRNHAVHRA